MLVLRFVTTSKKLEGFDPNATHIAAVINCVILGQAQALTVIHLLMSCRLLLMPY